MKDEHTPIAEDKVENDSEVTEQSLDEGDTRESIEGKLEEHIESTELAEQEPFDKESIQMNRNKKKSKKKIWIILGAIAAAFIFIYLGITFYFQSRFYFGSVINTNKVTGKTVAEVEAIIREDIASYTMLLKERGDITEEIHASEISLEFVSDGKVEELLDKQNPFKWPAALFKKEDYNMQATVQYDESLLQFKYDALSAFKEENIIAPVNAYPEYQEAEGKYSIVDEVYGTTVKKEELYELVKSGIEKGVNKIDLEKESCYIDPQFRADSPEVAQACDLLNKYVSITITHEFGSNREVLDGSRIHNWLTVNENWEIDVNAELAREYVNEISRKYETFGTTRSFTTSTGVVKQVPHGNYGWSVSRSSETETMIADIKAGENVSREPVWRYKAASFDGADYGNTYIEIDLTNQRMWFYKNGSLIVDTPVVTGNVSKGYTTPEGVFGLTYKERDATLNGEDYSSPVNFWMPFNGNIGVHDASWRSSFGGSIYRSSGSHGCVNTPYEAAKTIFEGVEKGVPVICYY